LRIEEILRPSLQEVSVIVSLGISMLRACLVGNSYQSVTLGYHSLLAQGKRLLSQPMQDVGVLHG
jgi:hypothetical protein